MDDETKKLRAQNQSLEEDKSSLLDMVDRLKCKKTKIRRDFDDLQMQTAEQSQELIKTKIELEEAKKAIRKLSCHSRKVAEDKKHADARWAWEKTDKIQKINKSYAKLTAALVQLNQPKIRQGWNMLCRRQHWCSNNAEAKNTSLSVFGKLVEQRKSSAIFSLQVREKEQLVDEFSFIVGRKELYVSLVGYTWPPYFDNRKLLTFSGTLQVWDKKAKTIDQFQVRDIAATNVKNQPTDKVLLLNPNLQRVSRLSAALFEELKDVFDAVIKPDWLLYNFC